MPDDWKPSSSRVPSLDTSEAEETIPLAMAEGYRCQGEGMDIRALPLQKLIERIRERNSKCGFSEAEWAIDELRNRKLLWVTWFDGKCPAELPDGTQASMEEWIVRTEMTLLTRGLERGDGLPEEKLKLSEPKYLTTEEYREELERRQRVPRPPGTIIQRAMKRLAEMLAGIDPFNVVSLEQSNLIRNITEESDHGRAAILWAIFGHMKAGRIKVEVHDDWDTLWGSILYNHYVSSHAIDDASQIPRRFLTVEPEETLWEWWKEIESSPSETSPEDEDAPATKPLENESCKALDEECRLALSNYGKAVDSLNLLSSAQKFYLVCWYWKDIKNMTPARIRDQFIEKLNSKAYHVPGKDSGLNRVKGGIYRGKAALAKL